MQIPLPEKRRQRKADQSKVKDSPNYLNKNVLKSLEKSTESSALTKTREFLKRNEIEKPDNQQLLASLDASFDANSYDKNLNKQN